MRLFLMILLTSYCTLGFSQSKLTTAKVSDPNAKAILDKLKKQYDGYKTLEVTFEMEIKLPGQSVETQKGTVIQDGKKYLIKMNDQEIYSDATNTWVYLKKNKEVQINSAADASDSEMFSPKNMMRIYETGDYAYAITDEAYGGVKNQVAIEFKPLSKKSEYTKMRLIVDKKSNKMLSLQIFSRDGSNYTLRVKNIISNKKYDAGLFVFNPKTVPGIHVEDLRMD